MSDFQAFFLGTGPKRRFCLYHPARGAARRALIYLHPWAEEMNKSRRMAALQARALAQAGYAVLQIDLLGCGDSAGDFSEATWPDWQADLLCAIAWLGEQTPAPVVLWGLRAGCLLAASVAARLPGLPDLVFWHPVLSGQQHWQQFMRLKMAGELASGQNKGVTEALKQSLAEGKSVEIAGYTVSPALAEGLSGATLAPPENQTSKPGKPPRLLWLELSQRPEATLSPASQKMIAQWQNAGFETDARCLAGPAFWQTAEIEEAPVLLEATRSALDTWP